MITNPFCQELHETKYRAKGESFRESMQRNASTLCDTEEHYRGYRAILLDARFIPAGRVQAAVGSPRNVTPYNCFVAPQMADSLNEDDPVTGRPSIMRTACYASKTMQLGGGIGYDFSVLRPRGDKIKRLDSYASGPVSFMEIFNSVCETISSAGHRRGAQMGVMRIDHPDVEEFILAKQNDWRFRGFNVSLAVTDEFMHAVQQNKPFDLRFGGQVYKTINARALWEKVMRSTWDWAEPGVLFIDRINEMNNLAYCEKIFATNPCGEQPLPEHGACLLGSFNLVRYLRHVGGSYTFDLDALEADIPAVVRAMDNVPEVATFPHPEQEVEAKNKRRMGLGVTGVANALEAIGHPYGSQDFCRSLDAILYTIANETYRASANLAAEKGAFPLFDRDAFLDAPFVQTLAPDVRDLIAKNGIRNSHLTSIAPTGTISLAYDNVSSGIEPVFAYSMLRAVNMPDGQREVDVEDYGVAKLGVRGKEAKDVTLDEHLRVLRTAAKRVDSAVSKTCNVPPGTPWEDFKRVYVEAWLGGAKGCTTFNVGGKRFGVLNAQEDGTSEPAQCRIDPETGRKDCE